MSSKNLPRPPDAGFTLIEILLAVAILAVISAIVSVSFATTFRLRDRALEDAAREHLARNTLRLIADELSIGRVYRKYRWYGYNADEEGRPADVLAFSTSAHNRVQPNIAEADVAHVVYTRKKDRLIRYSLRNPFAVNADAVDRTEIADGVSGFNIRYYHKRIGLWLDQWQEEASTMPAGILIELTLANSAQPPRTYTAWVPTPQVGTSKKLPPGSGPKP